LAHLTKPELVQLLTEQGATTFKKSAAKAELVDVACETIDYRRWSASLLAEQWLNRGVDATTHYLLFLFFGHVRGQLNQFSLRDMGIIRTRKAGATQARFDALEEACSAYYWACLKEQIRQQPELPIPAVEALPNVVGTMAEQLNDSVCWHLGKRLLDKDPLCARQFLLRSNHAKAQEKILRLDYQAGDIAGVETRLQDIIEQPPNADLLMFAEDFLARKYHKKKTSRLTDLLRAAKHTIVLEEVHKNRVERAVVEHYQQLGIDSYRTENELWKSLFGLVYWPILFASDAPVGNEFDLRPSYIVHNDFYQQAQTAIEALLTRLDSQPALLHHLTQQATQHYGKPNGIFRWHKRILGLLTAFVEHAHHAGIIAMLRAMARDYAAYKDGFPDIMVIDQGQLRFEEIKAEGDCLRKNQLLSIAALQDSGFVVDITTVEWGLNPQQPYVVVDIETTGGRAAQHRITEIGIVKVVNGVIVDRWHSLINPQRHIPRNITQLTGIDDEMVADAPIFAEIAQSLSEFTQGCVFVAHNVNFDFSFIKAEFSRIEQHFSRPKLCTVREMRKAFPGLPSYSLANLTRHFGIEMQRHHRAMSDAYAAAELLHLVNEKRMAYRTTIEPKSAHNR
jgi:DNA polymerase-3 subunit epsilon